MNILSIHKGHDATVCIIRNGRVVLNMEMERFTRIKNDYGYYEPFILHCLERAEMAVQDIDLVCISAHEGYYESDLFEGVQKFQPYPLPRLNSINDVQFIDISILGREIRCALIHHHRAHLASAFFTSPFEDALVLSLDGAGDSLTAAIGLGSGGALRSVAGVDLGTENWPQLWQYFCSINYRMQRTYPLRVGSHVRWRVLPSEGPGKIMALAAYGEHDPALAAAIYSSQLAFAAKSVSVKAPTENQSEIWFGTFFDHDLSDNRTKESRDFARTLQDLTDKHVEAMFRLVAKAYAGNEPATRNLCYAGGLALNCISTSRAMERTGLFDQLHVPPFPNDCGIAMGMALVANHELNKVPRTPEFFSPYTGPVYSGEEIAQAIGRARAEGAKLEVSRCDAHDVAGLLEQGHVVAMWRNRGECGPRALGHRSLLARPDLPDLRERMNKVKQREWYRPFAPIILSDVAEEALSPNIRNSYYMTTSAVITEKWRDKLKGVLHIDSTTRPQVIFPENEPYIYELIKELWRRTGIPAVMNTSFNLQEPIVETPDNAVRTFLKLGLDHLVMDDVLIVKAPIGVSAEEPGERVPA